MRRYYYPEDRIAIVGMGGIFPDAEDIQKFWSNLLEKKVSIKPVPNSLINSKVFYRPETYKQIDKQDKTYTIMGALVDRDLLMATGTKFKIPPAVAEQMDINQHGAIYSVDQALKSLHGKQPSPEKTAIIFGNSNPARRYDYSIERTFYALLEEYLRNNKLLREKLDQSEYNEFLQELAAEALLNNPPITEDTAPGHLQNLIAGRIANVFDFHGPSFTVDAACASSLAALISGIQGLWRKEYDQVITGGVDLGFNVSSFVAFSAINALSPDGSFPFDTRANGFIIGQGGGVIVMKRLEDALRDNDNIIALISGYGQGSDGKGKYIAAPNEEGQTRVIEQACRMSGYAADTIELIEAHGTGTTVGDIVEINGLKKAFSILGATKTNYCGVGSVKSNIGHLKSASGAAAIIKASLALSHKILPPTASVRQIHPKLQLDNSPFYIITEQRKWSEHKDHPNRANISSFGFGGANCHITMEEFRPEFYRKVYSFPNPDRADTVGFNNPPSKTQTDVVLFSGKSFKDITELYQRFTLDNNDYSFSQKVFYHNAKISGHQKYRLAIIASSQTELSSKWNIINEHQESGRVMDIDRLKLDGIYYGQNPPITSDQIALLFPGQASQYPNMGKELPEAFPIVQSFYAQADALWQAKYGYTITSLLYGEDETILDQELKNTKNTHPAMFLSCAGLYRLLSESGVKADYMVGHSLGEMTALFASEMLDLPTALQLIGARGFSFDTIADDKRGKMVSVKIGREEAAKYLSQLGADLYIANLNSPEQTVIGGSDQAIAQLDQLLTKKKVIHTILNVSHAFHTPLVAAAAEDYYRKISGLQFSVPRAKIVANHLQKFYPETQKGVTNTAALLKEQITAAVRFTDSIELLYEKGVRVFIEVGPSTVLSNLVKQILDDKEIDIIATNRKQKDAVATYYQSLAELFTLGIEIRTVPSRSCLTGYTPVADGIPIDSNQSAFSNIKSPQISRESLVYSGVSIGMPGSFKKIFAEDNFDLLCEGKNFIEPLTDEDLQNMLELNITRLIKTEEASTFKLLSSINDLIRLAGKLGELDMLGDYLVDDRTLQQMTTTICAGVAAGYEALKDAGIPLVREYITTSSGAKFPGRLVLPQEMQDDTGIIYASCFTKIEPFVREISKFIAAKFGDSSKQDLIEFYESLILQIKEPETKKYLTDWFARNYSRLNVSQGEEGVYHFNSDFMAQFSSLANNRLAQFIGASGPNFQLSAACSSTAYAVTVAESLIRSGQAGRMIVIGAENSSSKMLLPWIGGGFLTSGAATNEANIYNAAVPFDNRRNGMIIGAGAVGIIIEKEAEVEARGMKGICKLLGTHSFNLAGHQTRIDSKKYSVELDRFISRMEREYQLDRKAIAPRILYFSHETYTPKKGGCSQTEKIALETAFGDQFREIMVTNTKGMTGHTIGASIEEAVAAKCLQYQKVPPVVNYKEPDPELEGLKLSKGGSYSFDYTLRMVAGFGGQGNYILMQKIASGEERIFDQSRYHTWLEQAANTKDPHLELKGQILALKENEEQSLGTIPPVDPNSSGDIRNKVTPYLSEKEKVPSPVRPLTSIEPAITEQILEIYASVTKYPQDMLDLNMEVEADLGIDTVKQATIFAMISERFQLEGETDLQLSNYPTIGHVIALIMSKIGQSETISQKSKYEVAASTSLSTKPNPEITDEDMILMEVLKIISEVTKYPTDMLDLDMEMEADLGIDTVKQATIISYLSEKYPGPIEGKPQISSLPTIRDIVNMARQSASLEQSAPSTNNVHLKTENNTIVKLTNSNRSDSILKENRPDFNRPDFDKNGGVETGVIEIISEVTKYPPEMLELEMEMEADLGIDTVKQATIFSILGERFQVKDDQPINISEYKTIGAVIDFVKKLAVEKENSPSIDLPEIPTISNPDIINFEKTQVFQGDISYQIPIAVEAKLPPKDFSIKGKHVRIIGSHADTVEQMASFFTKDAKTVATYVFTLPTSSENIAAWIDQNFIDKVDVLLDCGDLGRSINGLKLSVKAEKELLQLNSEARFQFFKELYSKHPNLNLRIICAVSIDGEQGYANKSVPIVNPYAGVLSGFYKGLRKEREQSMIKIIDLNLSDKSDLDQNLASKIIKEIETGGHDFEIGYSGKTRKVIKLDELDQDELIPLKLPANPHFLITGGANGITAEVALGLAGQIKGKYTLIGRTVLPDNIAQLATLNENQLNQQRNEILNRMKLSEPKVTPLKVQVEFEKLLKAVSAYQLIEKIKKTGSKVLYLPCDVGSAKELQSAIDLAIKQHGPIQGIIHGAGIEKSHLLLDKSLSEFQGIFSVKADGICNLVRKIDLNQVKLIIGFSSISGRFGNEAQLDYCAANSFLSSYLRQVKANYPSIHVVSIAWSGWKDIGMAWRNDFVKNHAEESGINLIEPVRGVQALIKLLTNELKSHEVVVSKGLKGFVDGQSLVSGIRETPLIDWVTSKTQKIEKAYKVLSVQRDPLFDHHRLGTTPLVPAVGMMEICAEYHRLNFGPKEHYCFKKLSIINPLKLFHDQSQEIFVETMSESNSETLELSFNSYFKPKVGDPKLIRYSEMFVNDQLGDFESMQKYTDLLKEKYPEVPWRQFNSNPKWQFNNNINFGPLFVDDFGNKNNTIAYHKNGLVYTYTIPKEQLENEKYHLEKLLLNPCLMDTLFQAAAIHALSQSDRIHLPMYAEEIGVIRVPREIETLRIIAKPIGYQNETGAYDIIMIDSQNKLCYYAKNVMVRRINL